MYLCRTLHLSDNFSHWITYKMIRRDFIIKTGLMGLMSSTWIRNAKANRILPPALREGDTIGLISPAGPINEEKIQNAMENVLNMGLNYKIGQSATKESGYLAGTDKERLEDIHNMFANPDIKAIWCIRGGFGCTRILPHLNYDLIKNNPKILIGYSDVTALLSAIYIKTGLVGFHGPVAGAVQTIYSKYILNSLIMDKSSNCEIIAKNEMLFEKNYPNYIIRPGQGSGNLVGGNLSLLSAMCGTPYLPPFKNNIVFIEDIGEKPYRLDRMLTQLIQGSDIKEANGIVLGNFVDCEKKEGERSYALKEVILDKIGSLNIPSLYGMPFGHMDDQCTLPIGIHAELDTNNFSLKITEQSVS